MITFTVAVVGRVGQSGRQAGRQAGLFNITMIEECSSSAVGTASTVFYKYSRRVSV